MAQFEAAVFELGQWPVVRFGRIAQPFRVGQQRGVFEQWLGTQHFQYLLGIGLPVGGAVDVAADFEARRQLGHQRALDQAAFVVAGLVPGVGEKDVYPVQALFGQHVVDHFDRIMGTDADVAQVMFTNAFEQRTDAWVMHLAAQEVGVWQQRGNVGGGLTHAKTNFQHQWLFFYGILACSPRRIREDCFKIKSACLVRQKKARPQFTQGLGLACGGAPGAFDKTADGAPLRGGRDKGGILGHGVGAQSAADCRFALKSVENGPPSITHITETHLMSDKPALCASTSVPEVGAARRLRAILDALPDLLFEVDLAGRYLDYHSPRTDLLAAPAEVFIGKTLHDLLPEAIADDCLAALYEAHAKGFCQGCRIELMLPQGPRWFELSISRKDNGPDQPVSFIVLSRDVSEHVVAERKVQRLTQLYAALSQCNQAILRCQSEAELFPIICADAVKFGGMKLAWIGVMDAVTGVINPVTWAGEGVDSLSGLVIDAKTDASQGLGPSERALLAGEPYWFQDFANDPNAQVCHARAKTYGWGAAASLPLHRHGQLAGLLTVYAGEPHAFDEAARSLLLEMAMDISFALDRFADEADRLRTEVSLRDSENRYRKIFHTNPDAVNITRLSDGMYLDINQGFENVTGWTAAEAVGKTSLELNIWCHVEDRKRLMEILHHVGQYRDLEADFCRKDGSVFTGLMSAAVVRLDDVDCILAITRDISDKKRADERITQLSQFDQLTGLPNRSQLQARFEFARQLAQRSGEGLALMFLDLDHFKNINDTLGHSIGDRLLVQVAQRLSATLRAGDTLSRMGGDEFILLLPSVTEESTSQIAMKLLKVMAEPFRIDSNELVNTLSIGIAVYPYDGLDFETLSKNADTAMYRVKQASHNNFAFFTQEMQLHSARNLQLSNAMHFALARGEFSLHYQPQLSLQDGQIVGAEALLRWQHPQLGSLSPAEFVPIAEDSGQILAIGEWVLRTAVTQLKHWIDGGMAPIVVAVNLSAVQFRHPNLLTMVTRVLDEVGLPPQYLELELTEASAMDDPLAAVDVMNQLHVHGIRMAIDDFGTGYSSLSYLKKFKVSRLKIDQSFVRDIGENPDDKAIVTAIINLARSMGMQTIAEGVETANQVAFLQLQGCTEIQGYHFSKPLPSDQFETFVREMPVKARPTGVLATHLTRCSILPEGLVALTATAHGMVGNSLVQAARQAFNELMPAIHLAGVLTQVGSFMSMVPDMAQAADDPNCRYVAAALFGYSLASLSGECHKPDLRLSGTLAWQAIASGRYAVFTHVGPYDTLFQSWATIHNSWLPASGERIRPVPFLELMLNDPQTTPPELLRTEIWLPLR